MMHWRRESPSPPWPPSPIRTPARTGEGGRDLSKLPSPGGWGVRMGEGPGVRGLPPQDEVETTC